ncbi:hypothetical protein FGLOB1_5428 [Fusarium globosum]|uniref:Transposase n=1 Tax=Fusarium globosum TaxID=78864 RepID=A0A8H5YFX1_9HYPO|nr:hypothetical protein FGLOB1_5428 [Fusarium globosum]
MPLYCLSNNPPTKEKDAPMPARRQLNSPTPQGLRFRPHDGSEKAQERDFVTLSSAALGSPLPLHLYLDEFQNCFATAHVNKFFDNIIAAFRAVEQTMARDLAVRLIRAVAQLWNGTFTRGSTNRARVSAKISYRKLTGTAGSEKQLYYPDWFFMAVWLGPGHPLLQSIRKDMSDLWGVRFPTDAIMYPKFVPIETQMRLFYGKPAKPTTPKEASVEERAKAIKKTINDSTVNGLSAAIKGHLPDDLGGLGNSTRVHELEASHASMARELEEARKKVVNLEVKLGESRALQAKTKNDMETLRKEVQQLKSAQAQTGDVKKDIEAIRVMLTQHSTSCEKRAAGIGAKVVNGQNKVEKEMSALRSEVAQSAEKAEKAVETRALVLSVLSASGGQKRKMDEIS